MTALRDGMAVQWPAAILLCTPMWLNSLSSHALSARMRSGAGQSLRHLPIQQQRLLPRSCRPCQPDLTTAATTQAKSDDSAVNTDLALQIGLPLAAFTGQFGSCVASSLILLKLIACLLAVMVVAALVLLRGRAPLTSGSMFLIEPQAQTIHPPRTAFAQHELAPTRTSVESHQRQRSQPPSYRSPDGSLAGHSDPHVQHPTFPTGQQQTQHHAPPGQQQPTFALFRNGGPSPSAPLPRDC